MLSHVGDDRWSPNHEAIPFAIRVRAQRAQRGCGRWRTAAAGGGSAAGSLVSWLATWSPRLRALDNTSRLHFLHDLRFFENTWSPPPRHLLIPTPDHSTDHRWRHLHRPCRDCLCFTYYEDGVNSILSRDGSRLAPGKRIENIRAWTQLQPIHRYHWFYTKLM